MLFIDADHSYGGCLADINAWKKHVRPGGIVCGHDYSTLFQGVKRAVHEAFGWDVLVEGTVWAVRTSGGTHGHANEKEAECCEGKS